MISVTCNCGRSYELPDALAGQSARCKACGDRFRVPVIATAVPESVDSHPPVASRKPLYLGAGLAVAISLLLLLGAFLPDDRSMEVEARAHTLVRERLVNASEILTLDQERHPSGEAVYWLVTGTAMGVNGFGGPRPCKWGYIIAERPSGQLRMISGGVNDVSHTYVRERMSELLGPSEGTAEGSSI